MHPFEAMIHLNETVRRMGFASRVLIAGLVAVAPAAAAALLQLPLVGILYLIPGGLVAVPVLVIAELLFNLSAELARQEVDGPTAFAAAAFVGGVLFWWVALLWMWRRKHGSTKPDSCSA